MSSTRKLCEKLFTPIDIAPLVYFRICFGAFMVYHAVRYSIPDAASGKSWVEYYYVLPRLHFPYDGFTWLSPWPGNGMLIHFYIQAVLAFCVMVGLCYRTTSILHALAYWYAFLLDRCYFQNHYYLIGLFSLLLAALPANRAVSVDAWLWPSIRSSVAPAWTVWLLRFQAGIVYLYGGFAKLNGDWLTGEPLRTMLKESPFPPSLASFFQSEAMAYFVAYSGLFLDLLAFPLLLWKRTRLGMMLSLIAFHLCNSWLFSIGIFPWFMLSATVILFTPRLPHFGLFGSSELEPPQPSRKPLRFTRGQRATLWLLGIYAAIQILVPFRQCFYEGNTGWTDQGNHFSWRMMLFTKRCKDWQFDATETATGAKFQIDPNQYISPVQLDRMLLSPHLIQQFCRMVAKEEARERNTPRIEVRVIAVSEYNSRPGQLLIDPTVDLAAEPVRWFAPEPWIMPLGEPLQKQLQRLAAKSQKQSAKRQ